MDSPYILLNPPSVRKYWAPLENAYTSFSQRYICGSRPRNSFFCCPRSLHTAFGRFRSARDMRIRSLRLLRAGGFVLPPFIPPRRSGDLAGIRPKFAGPGLVSMRLRSATWGARGNPRGGDSLPRAVRYPKSEYRAHNEMRKCNV